MNKNSLFCQLRHDRYVVLSILFTAFALPISAHADDDWPCTVTLCLANPQGPTQVAECVPPIQQLWSELAHGHAFPTCDMTDNGRAPGNTSTHQWTTGENCPPQYQYWAGSDQSTLACRYTGVVTINLAGAPYIRVWWNSNSSVTENISAEAISTPGASTQFQDDYAAWQLAQAAAAAAAGTGAN